MDQKLSLREYLYSLRFYVLFVSIIFICAIVIGYNSFLSDVFSAPREWIEELSEGIKDFTDLYPPWLIFMAFFVVIFLNNAFTCFLDILLGPLLGIFPLFSIILNGGLIGWFAHEEGLIVFLAIVPHGMFEIPAFLISAAIGLKLGREALKRKEERHLKDELRNALRVYLILILVLLLIAALIESGLIVAALFLI
ncbi:MAG TPA: stage II sporulation protein M [Methanophagales archaeon]|nr:stage II sporulation protein M [Methanophagales archaeon]